LPLLQRHASPTEYARCLMNRAIALRHLGRLSEALAGYDQARRELRRSRQLGRIDEASLEYTTEWERLFHGAIDVALAAGRPDKAPESFCAGKAALSGASHSRPPGHQVNEPAEVLRPRLALTDWMRNCFPVAPRSESPSAAELEQFAQKVKTFF